MSLNKPALKTGILNLLTEMRAKKDVSDDHFADQLASLIETFVKSGTVTVSAGIAVATTGSAAAQTGATTATGTGTIS